MTSRIYPVERSGNLFILRASIGRSAAKPSILKFLVDTGASQTGVPISLLTELGYPVPENAQRIAILTGNGVIHVVWNLSQTRSPLPPPRDLIDSASDF